MAAHAHRIHRLYRRTITGTAWQTLVTESASNFFGAGAKVPTAEKWVAHGHLHAVLVRPTTGGGGHSYPFVAYREDALTDAYKITGPPSYGDLLGVSGGGIVRLTVSGNNFLIQVKGEDSSGSAIIIVELDCLFVGGPQ